MRVTLNFLKQKFYKNIPIGIILFFFFLSIYVLTMAGHFYVMHDQALYFVTQNFVLDGRFTYWPDGQPYGANHTQSESQPGTDTPLGKIGPNGYVYAKYGFGQSLAAVPLFLLGRAVFGSDLNGLQATVLVFSPLITALMCVLIFLFVKRLKFSPQVGFFVCLIYGLTTLAWSYTKYFFEQPLVSFLLFFSCFALYRYKQTGEMKWLLFSGIALGFSVSTRHASIIVTPLLLLYLLYLLHREKIDLKGAIHRFIVFVMPLTVFTFLVLGYNFMRFGSIWETGYGSKIQLFTNPIYEGIVGQLLSPGKGLFVYAPSLLLFFFGIKSFMKRFRVEALLFLSIPLIYLLFYSRHEGWDGGYSWGPRHMVTISVFLLLPMGTVIEKIYKNKKKLLLVMVVLLVGLSFLIQFLAVGLDYVNVMTGQGIDDSQDFVFEPKYSSVIALFELWPLHLKQTISAIRENISYEGKGEDFIRNTCLDYWFITTYAMGGKIRLLTQFIVPLILLSIFLNGYLIWKRIFTKI